MSRLFRSQKHNYPEFISIAIDCQVFRLAGLHKAIYSTKSNSYVPLDADLRRQ